MYRLTERAEKQFAAILAWSEEKYDSSHAGRYEMLMLAAMGDLADDPGRFGATPVPRTSGIRVYELRHSKNRAPRTQRIRSPWHKLIYRPLPDGTVEILAIVGLSYPSGRAARAAMQDAG